MRKIKLLFPCKFHEFFPHLNCIYYILPTYTGWKDFIFFLPLLIMKKLWGDGATFNGWKMHIQKKREKESLFSNTFSICLTCGSKSHPCCRPVNTFCDISLLWDNKFLSQARCKKPHDKSLHFLVLHMYWCRKYDLLNLFFLENIFMKNFSSWSPDTFSSEECIEL